MLASSHGGKNPPKTTDEPDDRNTGDCEMCGEPAEGFDAQTKRHLCAECAATPLGERLDDVGVSDR